VILDQAVGPVGWQLRTGLPAEAHGVIHRAGATRCGNPERSPRMDDDVGEVTPNGVGHAETVVGRCTQQATDAMRRPRTVVTPLVLERISV
jgi:hypothetical protein